MPFVSTVKLLIKDATHVYYQSYKHIIWSAAPAVHTLLFPRGLVYCPPFI